jgi:hypothetical protein
MISDTLFEISAACAIITVCPWSNDFASFSRTKLCSKKGCAMLVNWKKDVDAALAEAKAQNKPLLIDFSAAPA